MTAVDAPPQARNVGLLFVVSGIDKGEIVLGVFALRPSGSWLPWRGSRGTN